MPPLLAIFAWPIVGAVLFQRLRLPLAVLVTILAGYLLLPEKTVFDLPLLPSLSKYTVPALTAFALSAIYASQQTVDRPLPGMWSSLAIGRFLLAGFVITTALTILTNSDDLRYGPKVLAGLRPYDGFSLILTFLMFLLPAILARKYLASPEMHRLFLTTLCIAGLAYSLLALTEIRLSPQLNRWVYGFFPHSFAQHVRGNGFRPLVFLSHGLVLAVFFNGTILAAIGLSRVDGARRTKYLLAALWLLGTLVLSKSLGALAIALLMLPIALFLTARAQLMTAAVIASIFLAYPILRESRVIPIESILEVATDIDPKRASSLQTRLDNEEQLLAKARRRPAFGWGSWARWRVFDNETGADITISDGYWVIIIGAGGWSRYLFEFGLLTMPIFLLLWRSRRERIGHETSTIALILAANLLDLIPNASVTPITWILAGALWGRAELSLATDAASVAAPSAATGPSPRRVPAYRRAPEDAVPPPATDAAPEADAAPVSVYTRQTGRVIRRRPSVSR